MLLEVRQERVAVDCPVWPLESGERLRELNAALFRGEAYPGQTISAELWNPYRNIEWAAAYLVWLRDNYSGDAAVMLAAYNGGPANPVVKYIINVKQRMARVGL